VVAELGFFCRPTGGPRDKETAKKHKYKNKQGVQEKKQWTKKKNNTRLQPTTK
jgi:hypothetical protein